MCVYYILYIHYIVTYMLYIYVYKLSPLKAQCHFVVLCFRRGAEGRCNLLMSWSNSFLKAFELRPNVIPRRQLFPGFRSSLSSSRQRNTRHGKRNNGSTGTDGDGGAGGRADWRGVRAQWLVSTCGKASSDWHALSESNLGVVCACVHVFRCQSRWFVESFPRINEPSAIVCYTTKKWRN